MAASAISSFSPTYQAPNSQSDFRQTFGQLVGAINAGDLSGAQQAYASLSDQQANGQGPALNPNSPFAQALGQIGQALQGGDIGAAQTSLASLRSQGHGGHHHHHGGGSSAGGSTTLSTTSANAAPAANSNALDVTV
jgi:hypothetical protein